MKCVAVSEFKSHCLSLLEDVARTGEPLLVTKRARPLARITPSGNIAVARPQDTLRGIIVATARVLGARFVTSDSRIIDSKLAPTV